MKSTPIEHRAYMNETIQMRRYEIARIESKLARARADRDKARADLLVFKKGASGWYAESLVARLQATEARENKLIQQCRADTSLIALAKHIVSLNKAAADEALAVLERCK